MNGTDEAPHLARRLGPFDATMLVMGGIIGAGIFVNPAEVARHLQTPALIVGVWLLGGAIAMIGALVYAELASRRPEVGGQYAYLRDAFGPMPAFLYGWSLLLVIQSGGMAAVAITFARYFLDLTGADLGPGFVAAAALALLTAINCAGVRNGATLQNMLMLAKILALGLLVIAGLAYGFTQPAAAPATTPVESGGLSALFAIGTAMTAVMFSYGGWQTASFVSAEMRDPARDLVRGLLFGVAGVVTLYALVALTCVLVLGPEALGASTTPASDVMRLALGERGAQLIALGIAISALGFLSQGMLTSPRVYFAMAEDRLFFRRIATIDRRTKAPTLAILLQGAVAIAIALSGTYGQILSYVVSSDFLWFGLTGAALFVYRFREPASTGFRAPLHPWSTGLFVLACAAIVVATVIAHPVNSAIGLGILLAGVPACLFWLRHRSSEA